MTNMSCINSTYLFNTCYSSDVCNTHTHTHTCYKKINRFLHSSFKARSQFIIMGEKESHNLWFYLRDNCVEIYRHDTRLAYVDVNICNEETDIQLKHDGVSKATTVRYANNSMVPHMKPANCESLQNIYRIDYDPSGVITVPKEPFVKKKKTKTIDVSRNIQDINREDGNK